MGCLYWVYLQLQDVLVGSLGVVEMGYRVWSLSVQGVCFGVVSTMPTAT